MKKIVKYIGVTLLVIIILLTAAVLGYSIINLPDSNPVFLGEDSIVVPSALTDNDKEIKVMSFNIRCIAPEDDKQNNWTNRKEAVIGLIDSYSPDIIGFQEVKHSQYKYLIENLEDYAFFGIYRSGMGLSRGDLLIKNPDPKANLFNVLRLALIDEASAIFYKKSRFELTEYDTYWLSDTPNKPSKGWDASLKRIATYVKLKDHYTGEIISVYNTHFDHKGIIAREKSAELIMSLVSGDESKSIVMGDFNVFEGSDVYNYLTSSILYDSKYLAPEDMRDTGPTFNGFGNSTHTEAIDYVFVSEGDFGVMSYRIIKDKYGDGYYISDHNQLLVVLSYN